MSRNALKTLCATIAAMWLAAVMILIAKVFGHAEAVPGWVVIALSMPAAVAASILAVAAFRWRPMDGVNDETEA